MAGRITEGELSQGLNNRLNLFGEHTTNTSHVPYGGSTGGSSTAYTLANPPISSLAEGMAMSAKIHTTSGASPTLNWGGTGAKAIDGVGAGDLEAGKIYTFRFDGMSFQLQGKGGVSDGRQKVNLFVQTAQPTALLEGDIWIKSAIAIGNVYFRESQPTGTFSANDIWVDISGLQINFLKDTGLFAFVGRTNSDYVLETTGEPGRLIAFWENLVYRLRAVYDRLYRWDTSTSQWRSVESYYWKASVWNQFSTDAVGIQWVQATSAAAFGVRWLHTSVAYDNKMWVLGGQTQEDPVQTTGTTWYSTDGSAWTQGASINIGRLGHCSVVYDGKMWCISGSSLGGSTVITNATSIVYSTGGAWTQLSLGIGALHGAAVVFDNKVWLIQGQTNNSGNTTTSIWYTADFVTWTQGAADVTAGDYPNGEWGIMLLNHNNVLYAIVRTYGRVYRSTNGTTWTRIATTPPYGNVGVTYQRSTFVSFDNKMWIIGGAGALLGNSTWWSTDGINWTRATSNAGIGFRMGHASTVFNNKIWITGGYGSGYWDDVLYTF